MKLYLTYLLLVFVSVAVAQSPKPQAKPEDPPKAVQQSDAKLPVIADKDQAFITSIELQIAQLTGQQKDLVKQYQDIGSQIQSLSLKVGDAVDHLLKEANLDPKVYGVIPEKQPDGSLKLVFTKRPQPTEQKK